MIAGAEKTDELAELFPSLKGKARIDALNEAAWELRITDKSRAIRLAEYSLELCRKGRRQYVKGMSSAFNTMALCHWLRDDFETALPLARRADELAKRARDTKGMGSVATVLGLIDWKAGNPDAAWDAWQEAYDRFMQIEYLSGLGNSLMNLAMLLRADGQLETARQHYRSALDIMEREGNHMGVANIQNNIGVIDLELEDFSTAAGWFRRAFLGQRELRNVQAALNALCNLAIAQLRMGNCRRSGVVIRLSERYFGYSELPFRPAIAELAYIEYQLCPACPEQDPESALRRALDLHARGSDHASELKLGYLLPALYEKLGRKDDMISALRDLVRLQEDRFQRQSRFRLSKSRCIQPVVTPSARSSSRAKELLNPAAILTGRQRQILYLMGQGLMNHDIAHRLEISPHTVQAHRRQMAERLGVSGFDLRSLAVRLTGSGR